MNQDEYIETRLDDQIKFYSRESIKNQSRYKRWQVVKIITALLVTTLSLLSIDRHELIPYVVGLLGAFIIFVESFVDIFNYKKLWITYRITCENLIKEKMLFETRSSPYKNEIEAFDLLVQRCESIMENEKVSWEQLQSEKDN